MPRTTLRGDPMVELKYVFSSICAAALLAMLMLRAGFAADAETTMTLAVVPRLLPAATHRDWSPFVERLQRNIGVKIDLKVFAAFSEFEQYIYAGKADLAFINPYQAVELKKSLGFIPLVRDGSRSLSGVLVVRADGPIKNVADLNGKEIAFPHPNAFGASLHLRATLQEIEHISFKPIYAATHANVYRHVLLGRAAAGGGVNITLMKEPESLRNQLLVLYQTKSVAPHPLAAHPRVPEALREKIIQQMLDMERDATGRVLLEGTTIVRPVRANYAADYADLEVLHLDRYYVHTDVPEE